MTFAIAIYSSIENVKSALWASRIKLSPAGRNEGFLEWPKNVFDWLKIPGRVSRVVDLWRATAVTPNFVMSPPV